VRPGEGRLRRWWPFIAVVCGGGVSVLALLALLLAPPFAPRRTAQVDGLVALPAEDTVRGEVVAAAPAGGTATPRDRPNGDGGHATYRAAEPAATSEARHPPDETLVANPDPAAAGLAPPPTPRDATALLSALLMGVVEGLTEFLPISSTGHLILLGELIGFRGPPGKTFEIAIQFGAILAVIWIYRRTLWGIARGMWRPRTRERRYASNILLAFLPAMVLGATLHGPITGLLFTPVVVSVALILGGVAIILIERCRPPAWIHSVPEIGPLAALLVGLGQALAMVPGTSRSGATIIAALLIGVERRSAAEFSFVLAIPTMLAATAYSLWKARAALDVSDFGQIAVGLATSFAVALLVVRAVLAVIGRIGFAPFGWYRIALGTVMLAWLALR
jgi:undecaprenyl-diphosphatase